MKTVPEDGSDIRTGQELLGHNEVKATIIYTHVLNRGYSGVLSPEDRLPGPDVYIALGIPADAPSRSR